MGVDDLKALGLTDKDVVIGLAASGRTPYVAHALDYARSVGCHTVAIACNKGSVIGGHADLAIEPVCGPEVLTGSTRLKAGTAQKLILNMISTATMVGMGKVYQNLMVDVQQTNEKLVTRAQNICMAATECTREQAIEALAAANGHVKTAIVMILNGQDVEGASAALEAAGTFPVDIDAGQLPGEEMYMSGKSLAPLSLALAEKPKRAVIPVPAFSEYEQALKTVGCSIHEYTLRQEEQFRLKEDFLDCLTKETDMVFLCSPSNPAGQTIDRGLLFRIADRCEEKRIRLVVDECFVDFLEDPSGHTMEKLTERYFLKESNR